MKKTLIVAALAVSSITFGQEHKEAKEQHRKAKMEHMKDFSAEQLATLKTKETTLALDLTTSQQEQFYALYLKEATNRKEHLVKRAPNKINEKTIITSEERFERMNNKLDHRIAFKNKVKSILSDEQYQKWERLQQKNNSKRRKNPKRERN